MDIGKIYYASKFNSIHSFHGERLDSDKWEIQTIEEYEYRGNGHYRFELFNLSTQEKMSHNGWVFDKVEVVYDWQSKGARLQIIDPNGYKTSVWVGRVGSIGARTDHDDEEFLMNAVAVFNDYSELDTISEVCTITDLMKYYGYDPVEFIEFYKKYIPIAAKLPVPRRAEIEQYFIERIKKLVEKQNSQ